MFTKPDTLERTARRWRLQIMKDDMHYIEVQLNYDLARQVLEGEWQRAEVPSGSPAMAGREGRAIHGSDNRTFPASAGGIPYESVAMSEAGGSGALVTPTKLYTAGHVVYRNIPFPGTSCSTAGVCGWICSNNAAWTSANGCNGATWPRWRFGMGSGPAQITPTAETNWISGPTFVILTAFAATPSTVVDGYDYAAMDFALGTFSSAPAVGTHMGIIALSDTHASNQGSTFWQMGYPGRSNCPTNAVGTVTDCPGGTVELSPNETTRPYSWGELMATGTASITPGTRSAANSWGSTVDITYGHSGGPLLTWWTAGCQQGCATGWYVVGAASGSGVSPDKNKFARVTSTVIGWL